MLNRNRKRIYCWRINPSFPVNRFKYSVRLRKEDGGECNTILAEKGQKWNYQKINYISDEDVSLRYTIPSFTTAGTPHQISFSLYISPPKRHPKLIILSKVYYSQTHNS